MRINNVLAAAVTASLIGAFALDVVGRADAAWIDPTGNPPGGNISAPLNVSPIPQTKSGNLGVTGTLSSGTLTTDTNIYLDDPTAIATTGLYWNGAADFTKAHIDYDPTASGKLFISAGNTNGAIIEIQGALNLAPAGTNPAKICFGVTCITSWSDEQIAPFWVRNAVQNYLYPLVEPDFHIFDGTVVYDGILRVTNPTVGLTGTDPVTNSSIYGVAAEVSGSGNRAFGVAGRAGAVNAGSGGTASIGVYGVTQEASPLSYGIYGHAPNSNAYAGYFDGKLGVTGDLSITGNVISTLNVKDAKITEQHGATTYEACIMVRDQTATCNTVCSGLGRSCFMSESTGALWSPGNCTTDFPTSNQDCICC